MKLTGELEHEIMDSVEPLLLSGEEFSPPGLTDYLGGLLCRYGVSVKDIIRRCNLERSYGYHWSNSPGARGTPPCCTGCPTACPPPTSMSCCWSWARRA